MAKTVKTYHIFQFVSLGFLSFLCIYSLVFSSVEAKLISFILSMASSFTTGF